MFRPALILLTTMLTTSCATSGRTPISTRDAERASAEVAGLLTRFHIAAATADFETYFELFDDSGVFLGTDGTERWPVEEFLEFARPHFQGESAWIFVPGSQNISVARDGSFAWFDEDLTSRSYGQCRGSGVATKTREGWRIAQYNLSVPIPNDLLLDFVARIRGTSQEDAPEH